MTILLYCIGAALLVLTRRGRVRRAAAAAASPETRGRPRRSRR